MPNRYLGRDLANQRYLGRDVSSIRSFGRIVYEATGVDNALDLFRAGVPAASTIDWLGVSGFTNVVPFIDIATFDQALTDGTTPLANLTSFGADVTTTAFAFFTNEVVIGDFLLLWVDDSNFALYQADSIVSGAENFDVVSLEMMVAVGTTTTGTGTFYTFTDTAEFLRSVIEINGVWQPRDVAANALDLFREGVAAVDTLALTSLTVSSVAPFISLNSDSTTSLQADDLLSTTALWAGTTGAADTFLNDRTPIGSFVLLWRDDQNFALFEVDSHLSGLQFIDEVSVEATVAVGTAGSGPATIYVFTDTALFLRSVERNLGSDQWQPRAVLADPFVPILATVTYNSAMTRYEALATGGTGTLNYAWTFEIDGIRFRLDQIPFPNQDETDFSIRTNSQRMNFDQVPNEQGAFTVVHYDPTDLFPGHVVSNIGLTISDDTHDEFFAQDLSNVLIDPTTPNQLHILYLGNWRNASGLVGPISVSTTPIGTTVANFALGHNLDDITTQSVGFAGSASEFGAYGINGVATDTQIITPVNTRLGTITFESVPNIVMNDVANWEISILNFGSLIRSSLIRIGISQIA